MRSFCSALSIGVFPVFRPFVDRTFVQLYSTPTRREDQDGAGGTRNRRVTRMPRVKRTPAEQRLADGAGPEFLEALARGLRIVLVFNSDRRQLTLSDIARLVDLPRASVRRTLHTLVHLGFAETDGRLF